MRFLTVVLLGGCFLLSSLNCSVGQEQTEEDRHGQQHARGNERDEYSVPVRIIPDPTQEEKDQADAEKSNRDERREDENLAVQRSVAESSEQVAQYAAPMFYISAAALILSFVTVAASGAAAWFAFGSVSEARKATKVAQSALSVTQDTARKQLRAYMVLDGAEVPEGTQDGMLYAVVRLKNFGQSPATITHVGSKCLASTTIVATDFDDLVLQPYKSIIGGGGTIQFHAANTTQLLDGLASAVASGKIQIAMRIRIKYQDIYGDKHFAQFTRTIEGQRNLYGGMAVSPRYPDVAD